METIGLIAAMTQESAALLRCVKRRKRITLGSLRCVSFELSGVTCVLVTSGMGGWRAGEAARNLGELCSPRLLISFGIAGAVEADLDIGDVILADSVCQLEQGIASPLLPLGHWSEAAREAASQALAQRGKRCYVGTAVTTGGAPIKENQLGTLEHPILEMETYAIAQVAAEKGIPLFSLRAISDGPRAPIPVDLGEVMDDEANLKARKLIMAVIRNPRIVLQSRRMMRNSTIAADSAAIALVASLHQLG
jgi:adenosylhomocysteine nucleosidase